MAGTGRLTKRTVDAAVPRASRYIVWCGELHGFGLRVEPTGKKTFLIRYRAGGGRSGTLRQATVGRYGTITVEEARATARRLLGAAASGGDPLGDRKKARQAGVTVGEICDWYITEATAGRILGRKGRPIKASTIEADRGRIANHVLPLLGKRPVRTLSPHDFEEMQANIAARKTAVVQLGKRGRGSLVVGGSGSGARVLGMVKAILGHAARRGMITSNPAIGARKMAGNPRKFRLDLDQLRTLGIAMREAAADGENSTALAAIRVIALTGFRRGEVLGLKPEMLLRGGGGISLADSKTGPQIRPVGRAATEAIRAQIAAIGEGAWVFPSGQGDGHFRGIAKPLARVCKRAGLMGVTPHGLRHTFASVAAELGFSELTIAGLLGHSAGSVTAGYVHLDSALVAAADRVSAVIADALDGRTTAKVIPLREAGL